MNLKDMSEVLYTTIFGLNLLFRIYIGISVLAYISSTINISSWVAMLLLICAICYMIYPLLRTFKWLKEE